MTWERDGWLLSTSAEPQQHGQPLTANELCLNQIGRCLHRKD